MHAWHILVSLLRSFNFIAWPSPSKKVYIYMYSLYELSQEDVFICFS